MYDILKGNVFFLFVCAKIGLKSMVPKIGTYLHKCSPLLPFRCLDFLMDGGRARGGQNPGRAWVTRLEQSKGANYEVKRLDVGPRLQKTYGIAVAT